MLLLVVVVWSEELHDDDVVDDDHDAAVGEDDYILIIYSSLCGYLVGWRSKSSDGSGLTIMFYNFACFNTTHVIIIIICV